uniref:Uncharacterized protein LOC114349128 n=1 Tax=Diabrotica virgifera virgifera TaxID=50390 RepID=A0A6P7H024_DIAVI
MVLSTDEEEEIKTISGLQVNHTNVDIVASTSFSAKKPQEQNEEEELKSNLQKGNFVVVEWNKLLFPGIAVNVSEEGAVVECMERTNKCWKWPKEKDSLFYKWSAIKKKIQPPKLLKRGLFSVSNL